MSGVDVLAHMDLHIAAMAAGRHRVPCRTMKFYDESREKFEEARAAVAELIEAASDVLYELRDKSDAKNGLMVALSRVRGAE